MLPILQAFDPRPDSFSSALTASTKSTVTKNPNYSTLPSSSIGSLNEKSASSTTNSPSHTLPISSAFFRDELHDLLNAENDLNSKVKSSSYQTTLPPKSSLTLNKESEKPPKKNYHTLLPSAELFPSPTKDGMHQSSASESTCMNFSDTYASTHLSISYGKEVKEILPLHSSSQSTVENFQSSDCAQTLAMTPPKPISSSSVQSSACENFNFSSSLGKTLFNQASPTSETFIKEAGLKESFLKPHSPPSTCSTITPSMQKELLKTPNLDENGKSMLSTCAEEKNNNNSTHEPVTSPAITSSGSPSSTNFLGFPIDDIQSVDKERNSLSPQSFSHSPSLHTHFNPSTSKFSYPIAHSNSYPKQSVSHDLYQVPTSPSFSSSFSSVDSSASFQPSSSLKKEKVPALSPLAVRKLTPPAGAVPQAKLQRRHSDFGPISSPASRQHVSTTDVATNARPSSQQHPLHQTHSYNSASEDVNPVPITPCNSTFSSDTWNTGLSKLFFTSPVSNVSQKSLSTSPWSPLFPPEDPQKETDTMDKTLTDVTNQPHLQPNVKNDRVRQENPSLKITIPPSKPIDNPLTPHSSTESSVSSRSTLPTTFTRYLKISNISVSFPASEKSRLFQSLSEVQHMIHRLVGSSMFCLYLSFYDSRHVLQFLQQLQEPPLKNIVVSHGLDLKPIMLTEFQDATELNLSEAESCSELVVRGVTNESESSLKDLLMFYGEIMSLQRLHQSGCLLVNYFDVRSAEKAFNLLPNLARSLHQIEVTVERPSRTSSAEGNAAVPGPHSNSMSRVHTLKVEASNLEAVSYLDTSLLQSINREHSFHSSQSQPPSSNNNAAPTKSSTSPSLSSNNLSNSSTNLCEPLWSPVYPPITRRATEMPYSYSQQQLRNSFMCKAVPAAAAAEDFPTTGMDDFLIKPTVSDLSSPTAISNVSSSLPAENRASVLNTNDSFLTEQIVSTRSDSPSRAREQGNCQTYFQPLSYPQNIASSFTPSSAIPRSNNSRLSSNMTDITSACTAGCKHSSVSISTNPACHHQHSSQSSSSLSFSSSPMSFSTDYDISPLHMQQQHCSPQRPQLHHHHQHHLRHHNHYHHSLQNNKKQSNYGYSTCLRSNSALPKIDLIPRENEFELERILEGKDNRTTIMIRNIPNKYSQQMLLDFINESHKGQYDFLYLRMDFKNRCNVGYAFCNLVSVHALCTFAQRVIGKKWTRFNSDKVCMLSYANIQGKQALIEKFRNSSVMDEHPSYRPKIFNTSGPFAGGEEVFPLPVNRAPRLIATSSSSSMCSNSHLSNRTLEYNSEEHEEKTAYFCDYSAPTYSQFQEYSAFPNNTSPLPLDSPLPRF